MAQAAPFRERFVKHTAAIATKLGCDESTVRKVTCVAEFSALCTASAVGVLAERAVDHINRAIPHIDGEDGLHALLKGYTSDDEPEEVQAHQQYDVAEQLYNYIRLAWAAYGSHNLAERYPYIVKKSTLIHDVDEASKFMEKLASTDTEVHVCILDEGTAAFVFRGTESPISLKGAGALFDWKSWIKDTATDFYLLPRSLKLYDAGPEPVYNSEALQPEMKVHKGFQLALKDVTGTSVRKDNLRMVLEDMGMKPQDVKKVVCIGHSLGGALATLCAKWCREVAYKHAHITCVTIGSPRVGNRVFAHDFNTRVVDKSYRVVNKGDPIPCFPHHFSGYKHVKGGIYLAKHPTLQDSIACTWGGFRTSTRMLNILDHHPKNYLSSFAKVLLHHNNH